MTATLTPTEIVQSCYEAFGRGDVPFILSHIADNAEWVVSGEGIPASGSYNGPAGAAEFFRILGETENITRFEPRQFIASGDDVVALGYEECTVRATGKKAATNWAMHFRVVEGKVVRWESFFDTAAYANAHWP